MRIKTTIEKYISAIKLDEFHRYRSWDHCHRAYSVPVQNETHILELAFYLASWGMYRGSCGLLQKNHLIHCGAVDILFYKRNRLLKCSRTHEVSRANMDVIFELKSQLCDYYGNIRFTKGLGLPKPITTTDTLISKIMLGTLGCVPAYDRYFIIGLKESGIQQTIFNKYSLMELFDFSDQHKIELSNAQKFIAEAIQSHYPYMKIFDIYFWQIGYEHEIKTKNEKA